ncbi:MAG: hypothetical protein WCS51_05680 [Bacilli bacterium]
MNDLKQVLYDYITSNCVGENNAIHAQDLCLKFGLINYTDFGIAVNDRKLRSIINNIRNDKSYKMAISSSSKGYFAGSKEEEIKSTHTLYALGFALLKVARAKERKAALNGQGEFTFDEQFSTFIKSLAN